MFELLFFLAITVLAYIYAGYPIVLALLAQTFGRDVDRDSATPTVTIVLAAHQEASVIQQKLENFDQLDYPAERLKMLVVSDASTDGTDEIVTAHSNSRVTLLRQTPRAGKASALNLALANVDSEVLIFTDANVFFEPDALYHLLPPLADPEVGIVTGVVHLVDAKTGYAESEGAYYRYERFLQEKESAFWSVVGVDGALFAAKREVIGPPPSDAILDDFVMSMAVACSGKRIIYEPRAKAVENAAPTQADEFRRKVRVGVGAFQSIARLWSFPPIYLLRLFFCYLSHKLLRWLTPWFMLLALATNGVLAAHGDPTWLALFSLQTAFYISALLGLVLPASRRFRLISIPMYFVMMNAAFALGLLRFAAFGSSGRWKPTARTQLNSEKP